MDTSEDEIDIMKEDWMTMDMEKYERQLQRKRDKRAALRPKYWCDVYAITTNDGSHSEQDEFPVPASLRLCLRCRGTGHAHKDCHNQRVHEPPDFMAKSRDLSSLTATNPKTLCDRCRAYRLLDLVRIPDARIVLGPGASIILRSDCPLCILIFSVAPDPHHYNFILESTIVAKSVHVYPPKSHHAHYSRGLQILRKEPGSKYANENEYAVDREAICMVDNVRAMGGRIVDASRLDATLLRKWIDRCVINHSITCKSEWTESLRSIRLIDVKERKIVNYPENGEPVDYVILSYVWGRVKPQKFELNIEFGKIPQTIEDALTLTKELGKRYLWADLLCIDQFDPTHKASQIRLMAEIYTGAWATIVAAYGSSAKSGLPRVSFDPKVRFPQARFIIDGTVYTHTMPGLQWQLENCTIGTRAWCFQEVLMSRRCLYFTQHQVYFECNLTRCCESLDDSKSALHVIDEAEGVTDSEEIKVKSRSENPLSAFQKQGFMWRPDTLSFDTTFKIRDYSYFLTEYSQRQMTQKSDAINAFGAMIQQLTATIFPKGFFWGIPTEILQYALLWEHFGKTERREGFPSWSWAGWVGYIWPASSNRMSDGLPAEVALRAFKVLENGHLEPIHGIDSSMSTMILCRSKEKDPVLALGDKCASLPPIISYNPHHLIIDGVTLRLQLPRVTASSRRRLHHSTHPEWLEVFLGLPQSSDPNDRSDNVEPETESINQRSSWLLQYLQNLNDKVPQKFLLLLRKYRPPKVRCEFLLLRQVGAYMWERVAAITWFLDFAYLKELEHPDFELKREWVVLR